LQRDFATDLKKVVKIEPPQKTTTTTTTFQQLVYSKTATVIRIPVSNNVFVEVSNLEVKKHIKSPFDIRTFIRFIMQTVEWDMSYLQFSPATKPGVSKGTKLSPWPVEFVSFCIRSCIIMMTEAELKEKQEKELKEKQEQERQQNLENENQDSQNQQN